MALKSAISGEFIITQEDNHSIRVCKIFDNVIGSLREAAAYAKFAVNPSWNTRQFGKELIKAYGDGKTASIGEYTINLLGNGSIETYRVYGNTLQALREITATLEGFHPHSNWNTRTYGSKLIDFVNGDYVEDDTQEIDGISISPKMKVAELQDKFKEMFGGHLRIKQGAKRLDAHKKEPAADITLAEAGCKASGVYSGELTVAEFEKKVKDELGLSVIVATPDDWVTALPEFTLDAVQLLPNNTTKEKMQEILNR